MAAEGDSLNTIARSAGLNMVAQVLIRLLSFLMNAVLIRFVSIDYIGVVNVRLHLLATTIVFLTREPIRKVCFDKAKEKWSDINRIVWIWVPIGLVLSTVLSYVWMFILPSPRVEFYKEAVLLYALSSLIVLSSESLFIVTQISLHTNIKVFVESTALTIRSLLNCLLLGLWPSLGLRAFCISEVIYACAFPALYLLQINSIRKNPAEERPLPIQSLRDLAPPILPIPSSSSSSSLSSSSLSLPEGSLSLLILFFKQSGLKQLLTEGERYVLSLSTVSMHDQGVYEIVNNLGSLFARFLFQPLEEGFYLYFSREGNREASSANSAILAVCCVLLRCLNYFGCIVIGFGLPYASALLYLYGGASLATPIAIAMLRLYCIYVLFLGQNGISEAFFMATAPEATLERYNGMMGIFSIVFVILSLLLTPWLGSAGYIVANIVNMICRCIHHIRYLRRYGENQQVIKQICPSLQWLTCLVGMSVLLLWNERRMVPYSFKTLMIHVGIGGLCGVAVLVLLFVLDKKTVREGIQLFRKREEKKED